MGAWEEARLNRTYSLDAGVCHCANEALESGWDSVVRPPWLGRRRRLLLVRSGCAGRLGLALSAAGLLRGLLQPSPACYLGTSSSPSSLTASWAVHGAAVEGHLLPKGAAVSCPVPKDNFV